MKNSVEKVLKDEGISKAENHLWIGGETASLYDTKQITERDEAVIIPVMISIIALLLLVYLRSIVAMIYLIVTVVLSFFSALGAAGFYCISVWELPQYKVRYRYMHSYF